MSDQVGNQNVGFLMTRLISSLSYIPGKLLSRQILFVCWEGVLDVLSVLLNGKSNCGITSSLAVMIRMEGAKEESMRAREAMCKCLDGLQKAAKLCCLLGTCSFYILDMV